MNMPSKLRVKVWMLANYSEHVEALTGELNTTRLTEDAALTFNLYEDADGTVDDTWYDLAYEVERILVARGVVEPIGGR